MDCKEDERKNDAANGTPRKSTAEVHPKHKG